jgi:hypothetical protein
MPTLRRTARCLETVGWGTDRPSTNSLTARACPSAKNSMISRLRGSAIALNTSLVVLARATAGLYSHIGICATTKSSRNSQVFVLFTLSTVTRRSKLCESVRPVRDGRTGSKGGSDHNHFGDFLLRGPVFSSPL